LDRFSAPAAGSVRTPNSSVCAFSFFSVSLLGVGKVCPKSEAFSFSDFLSTFLAPAELFSNFFEFVDVLG
jgi:hypothetical protein